MRCIASASLAASAVLLGSVLTLAAAFPAAAGERYLTLSRADCARLARHYPADGVAYEAGRDVRGKPVVPADVDGGSGLILPEAVIIPIEVDLFERFGIPADEDSFKGDIFIGEVVVDVATGRAIFNGQPLQSEAEAELAARCQRILRDRAEGR
jgi:hypothetical protein